MIDFKKVKFGKELSQEEKINYIYNSIKTQQVNARIKFFVILLFFMYGYYFFINIYPTIPKEKIENIKSQFYGFISSQISQIAKPFIEEISEDMLKKLGTGETINPTHSQDLIDKVLNEEKEINMSKLEEFYQKHPELKK